MRAKGSSWSLALIFLVLAGATRFYRLDWSFSGDETTTFTEVETLFERPFFSDQLRSVERLPRALPVAYGCQYLTYRIFGKSEFGARTGVAIAGTLAVGISVLLTGFLFGPLSAFFLGVMLLVWPWQLGCSQANRMYSYAFLFGSTAILSGALAFERDSLSWAALSGISSALAVSSHSLTLIVPVSLGLYATICLFTGKESWPRRAVLGYASVGVPLILVSCLLGWLAMRNWLQGVEKGYGVLATYMALAFNLGWGVALLSAVGWFWAWRSKQQIMRLLAITAAVTLGACLILPEVASFRHDYVFSVSLAFVLLACRVLVVVFERLRPDSALLAWGIAGMVFLLPMPSLVSYYQDGDRKSYREAAAHIRASWQEGDMVAADSNALLQFYLSDLLENPKGDPDTLPDEEWARAPVKAIPRPTIKARLCIQRLSSLAATGGRVWYVCRSAREEPPTWADQWLWQHAVRMKRFKKRRFDYHENITDVLLLNAGSIEIDGLPQEGLPSPAPADGVAPSEDD